MTLHDPEELDAGGDRQLRAELIARFGLSAENLEHIHDAMQSGHESFAQAALRLGFVNEADVEEAMIHALGHAPAEQAGLIETAIQRISSDRRIVLRQGERLTPGPQLVIAHDPDHKRSENLRALRTELLLLNEGTRGANVVAVVSADAGEGRSQLAAELAIVFAQLGRRTLLVDADMRKPRQHLLFGAINTSGVSQAVSSFEKPIYHPVTGLPLMHILPAGTVPPNPLELLSGGRFEKLMTEWKNTYEFLVLDTPPISQYADGLAVATLAGRVLVLGRAQHSAHKSTRELLRRLRTTQAKVLGAVLNHF